MVNGSAMTHRRHSAYQEACVQQLTSWELQSIPNQLQIPWILACPAHSFKGPSYCSLAVCKRYARACSEAPHPTAGCMDLQQKDVFNPFAQGRLGDTNTSMPSITWHVCSIRKSCIVVRPESPLCFRAILHDAETPISFGSLPCPSPV